MGKKGFTLIELLAVIVILAVISFISIPIVLSMIEKSKKSAFIDSAYGLMKSAESEYMEAILEGKELPTLFEYPFDQLKFGGKKPDGGKIVIDEKGNVGIVIYNDKWCIKKEITQKEVSITKYESETCKLSNTIDIEKLPIITIPDSTTIKITEVSTFDLLEGVTAKDRNGESIIPRVSGSLSATLGEQTIIYIATDKEGNTVTKTRTITVVASQGPILNFNILNTNNKWVKAQDIIVTATDHSNLSSFTYEVIKDNVSLGVQTVEVDGKSIEVTIPLNQDGKYSIKLTGSNEYGNNSEVTSGIYKIDVTKPTITMSNVTIKDIETTDYDLMTGVTISDNSKVMPTVNITGTISEAPKDYTITYTVTDEAENVEIATRIITVQVAGEWIVANTSDHGSVGNVPVLNGLVAVKYRTASDQTTKWYDYEKQMWANAVAVTDEYRNASVGTMIPESEILGYFVWIPRYEYQYTNLGTSYAGGTKELPGQINVNFIATTKTSPSTNYKVHPAFTFGTKQLSGIWVGKFETTGTGTSPTIKPNLSSLRDQNVSTKFSTAKKFSASGNKYGINTSADAHMMKNSEWGAVAYLSQSKYGKRGNPSYTGTNKEIYINNNSKFITGCSGGSPNASFSSSCTYTYEKALNGTGASTTGTIYGIYDMSGGAFEYVMGVYNKTIGNSGFSSLPNEKYYDNYTTGTASTACSGGICYGHALSETSGWYSDYAGFVFSGNPWFIRGAHYSYTTDSGIFYFTRLTGSSGTPSFRVVLLS